MEKTENPIYSKNTLEFVTVTLEFCTFVEGLPKLDLYNFVDKTTKILPLLYLKASLLPEVLPPDEEVEPEQSITEDMYEQIRSYISNLLGEKDAYLETFHTDMKYSETPIIAYISENLADIYQDIGNFVFIFREGFDAAMEEALSLCRENFRQFWGQQLLNALKALHYIRYNEDLEIETNNDTED